MNKLFEPSVVYDHIFNRVVFEEIPKNSLCLDIGCWIGNLGEKLIREKACVVDGVDYNRKSLVRASKIGYRRVFNINLNDENYNLNEIGSRYDYIILADILEHLINPMRLLISLKKKLKKNAYLVISIPNGAFILLRLYWLIGKIDYSENGGLMDISHLRFFTSRTIKELLTKSGFEVIKCKGYGILKNYIFMEFVFNIFSSILGAQFLLKAKLKKII